MTRCLEIEWHGPGVFSHIGARPVDWQGVLDRAAAIRLLENVDLGAWTGIYEVDVVVQPGLYPKTRTAQFLVSR